MARSEIEEGGTRIGYPGGRQLEKGQLAFLNMVKALMLILKRSIELCAHG